MKTQTQESMLKDLYLKFGLIPEDVYVQRKPNGDVMYKIITRTGVDKIRAALSTSIKLEMVLCQEMQTEEAIEKSYRMNSSGELVGEVITKKIKSGLNVVVKASVTAEDGNVIETYGESSPLNTRAAYYVAIAQKRAISRLVLFAAGLYEQGFYGEDESDEFSDKIKQASR